MFRHNGPDFYISKCRCFWSAILMIISMRRIAQSSSLSFDLRCYIPEKMFTFVLQNYLPLSRADTWIDHREKQWLTSSLKSHRKQRQGKYEGDCT